MRIVEGLVQGSPEWHEFRQQGICSSDISALMQVSPWAKPIDIFRDKTGFSQKKETTPWMRRGSFYEGDAREIANEVLNMNFKPVCCIHKNIDHFRASLDGYDEITNSILEIKVPGKEVLELAEKGMIPEYYKMQMQWQMMVTGSVKVYYFVYNPDNYSWYTLNVARDDQMITDLVYTAEEFWYDLMLGSPPEKTTIYVNDDEAYALSLRYEVVDELIKSHTKEKELLKQRLIDFGDDGDFRVGALTFRRTEPRKSYDLDAMRADGIDLEKYVKKNDGIGFYTVKVDKK